MMHLSETLLQNTLNKARVSGRPFTQVFVSKSGMDDIQRFAGTMTQTMGPTIYNGVLVTIMKGVEDGSFVVRRS